MHGCETKLPMYVSKSVKNGRTFYRLRKSYKKQEIQIVQHPQLEYILKCRQQCEEVNWNKDKIQELKKQFQKEKPLWHETQYIYPDDKGGWRVCKWERGRVKYYGKAHSISEAVKIRDYLVDHNWKKPLLYKRKVSPNKYLRRTDNGRYLIHKDRKGYGTYDSWNDAVCMRNRLIENGWDDSIVEYERGRDRPDRYINIITYKGKQYYHVKKVVDGVSVLFGTYHSLEDARCERDFWESINWDFDLLDLY